MNIKVTRAPVLEAKHGVTDGRVFEVLERGADEGEGRERRYRRAPVWVMGDAGERVKLYAHEYEQQPRRPDA